MEHMDTYYGTHGHMGHVFFNLILSVSFAAFQVPSLRASALHLTSLPQTVRGLDEVVADDGKSIWVSVKS